MEHHLRKSLHLRAERSTHEHALAGTWNLHRKCVGLIGALQSYNLNISTYKCMVCIQWVKEAISRRESRYMVTYGVYAYTERV